LHLTGGSNFDDPHVQNTGLTLTHWHGLQKPMWQKSVQLCLPHVSCLPHTIVQVCFLNGSPALPSSLFAVQHISVHLCFLQDFILLQILLHLKFSISFICS